jgi:hypothetical protein
MFINRYNHSTEMWPTPIFCVGSISIFYRLPTLILTHYLSLLVCLTYLLKSLNILLSPMPKPSQWSLWTQVSLTIINQRSFRGTQLLKKNSVHQETEGLLTRLQNPASTLREINPVHTLPPYFLKIHFDVILPFMTNHQNIQLRFPHQNYLYF